MNIKKQVDTMAVFLQKQPYSLTLAKHTLNIHQMRIMAWAIQALQPHMSAEIDYNKPMPDVWLNLNISELVINNNVRPLRAALDSMIKKVVRIFHSLPEKGTCLEIGMPLIKEYEYEHGTSFVKIQVGGRLLPQLLDLAKGYTRYSLNVAFETSSPNVFRLYQYFAHFRDKRQVQCNVETLRKWLQLEGKYSMPSRIRERIIDPAARELKEKADVWFEVAGRVTKGRKMVGWKFNIFTKKEPKNTPKKDAKRLPNNLSKTCRGGAVEHVSDFISKYRKL